MRKKTKREEKREERNLKKFDENNLEKNILKNTNTRIINSNTCRKYY